MVKKGRQIKSNAMDRINELSDDLLVKILSFVPTKVSVSTSILSKRWEFLWMWVPKLEYIDFEYNRSKSSLLRYRDFINKNLPLHKAPIIESLRLRFLSALFRHADLNLWVEIAVSRCVRELELCIDHDSVLPNSLYTCKSLVTLKLEGNKVRVNVHGTRLVLFIHSVCSSGGCVIDTPSLKYCEVEDHRDSFSYSINHMPKLEEADVTVGKGLQEFLGSITSVKRLTLTCPASFKNVEEFMYPAGIVFDQLENLKLITYKNGWLKLLFRLLNDSPKLRVLRLPVFGYVVDQEQISCSIEQSWIPECLLKSLETFEFEGCDKGKLEEREFLSFLFKHARCLKPPSFLS
ncbi:unnamed protein product [Thlaspi arvense]|uniref:FBD domain-containing protein n=1 Tax=Thlaspi arvense TaxID=13288 RepID=A0AAU9ST59_THLAR|nr:unnamed protein product [Thlaspi arvense]